MKVTREQIEGRIETERVFRDGTLTIVVLTLDNGYKVLGQSACVDPAEYERALGYKIAYDNAFDEIWQLEGYLLRERMHGAQWRGDDMKPKQAEQRPLTYAEKTGLTGGVLGGGVGGVGTLQNLAVETDADRR